VQILERIDAFNEKLDAAILKIKNRLKEICEQENLMEIESRYADFEKQVRMTMEEALSDLQDYLKEIRVILEIAYIT
jgi:phage tail tape-measure protein